jgi:hypothetical protein
VKMNGILKRVKLCTKCLRMLKKEMLEKTSPKSTSPAVAA